VTDSLNTFRAVLVALAALAAIISAVFGQYLVAAVLGVGVLAHGGMWLYLYRTGQGPFTTSRS
jgi:hypothetical protein